MTILVTSFKRAAIPDNSVTNAKLAQMAAMTIKGNNTGATANAIDLSTTQAGAMISPHIKSTRYSKGNISGSVAIDASNGDYQICTTTATVTGITISNLPTEQGMILSITNSGSYTVTFNSVEIIATTETGVYACAFYNDNGTVKFFGKSEII